MHTLDLTLKTAEERLAETVASETMKRKNAKPAYLQSLNESEKQANFKVIESMNKKISFLKSKKKNFIAWICPNFKVRVTTPKEYVYYEGESIEDIFFLKSGSAHYVLP